MFRLACRAVQRILSFWRDFVRRHIVQFGLGIGFLLATNALSVGIPCASTPPADRAETIDKHAHGRQEHRRVETFDIPTGTLDPDWDGLIVAVIRVSRLTWHKDTKLGLWHKTDEISLYAAQTRLSAVDAAAAIRGTGTSRSLG